MKKSAHNSPIKEAISGRVKPLADYDEFKNISNADGTTSLRETDTFDTFLSLVGIMLDTVVSIQPNRCLMKEWIIGCQWMFILGE